MFMTNNELNGSIDLLIGTWGGQGRCNALASCCWGHDGVVLKDYYALKL